MALSLFLAKLLGLYMLIIVLIALLRKEQFFRSITSIMRSEGVIALSGVISLVGGLAIVIGHPIFEWDFRGIITLFGLLAIAQGVLRLGFTAKLLQMFPPEKFERHYLIIIAIPALLGAYLTYSGFSH